MEHQEIYEWLKELAFKNCDKENREQIFWFFEDILEDEIKVEKQEDEIERLNNIINELEKWVKSEYDRYYNDKENLVLSNVEVIDFGRVLDKLRELKESENNEKIYK